VKRAATAAIAAALMAVPAEAQRRTPPLQTVVTMSQTEIRCFHRDDESPGFAGCDVEMAFTVENLTRRPLDGDVTCALVLRYQIRGRAGVIERRQSRTDTVAVEVEPGQIETGAVTLEFDFGDAANVTQAIVEDAGCFWK
jgi:hypothetical protein